MNATAYLLDTGPLIALLNRSDEHHEWARRTLDAIDAPALTCEAVLSEAWFLAQRFGGTPERVLDLVDALDVSVLPTWTPRTIEILHCYASRASVADAALLSLAEMEIGRVVVTTDRVDFAIYRLRGSEAVPSLMPPRS